jgi:hypothetical protein
VTAPNADTLYTTTWIDVSKEPWVLSLPDMKGRYYLFPMLDGQARRRITPPPGVMDASVDMKTAVRTK